MYHIEILRLCDVIRIILPYNWFSVKLWAPRRRRIGTVFSHEISWTGYSMTRKENRWFPAFCDSVLLNLINDVTWCFFLVERRGNRIKNGGYESGESGELCYGTVVFFCRLRWRGSVSKVLPRCSIYLPFCIHRSCLLHKQDSQWLLCNDKAVLPIQFPEIDNKHS